MQPSGQMWCTGETTLRVWISHQSTWVCVLTPAFSRYTHTPVVGFLLIHSFEMRNEF